MMTRLLNAGTPDEAYMAFLMLSPQDRAKLPDVRMTIENPAIRYRLGIRISWARALQMFVNAPKNLPPGAVI